MQGVFRAPDGTSTAMQLFHQEATHLCTAVRESSVYQAHLCGFFALLGAMPQCLKAEADAIMLMIRTAREKAGNAAAEAQPKAGDTASGVVGTHLILIFILSASQPGMIQDLLSRC